jgi:hypothetical protein
MVWMSIDTKWYVDSGGGHIDIEYFIGLKKFSTVLTSVIKHFATVCRKGKGITH